MGLLSSGRGLCACRWRRSAWVRGFFTQGDPVHVGNAEQANACMQAMSKQAPTQASREQASMQAVSKARKGALRA
eukprot:scaffold157119_cov17-Tisochrysis_lutea.AAC.1